MRGGRRVLPRRHSIPRTFANEFMAARNRRGSGSGEGASCFSLTIFLLLLIFVLLSFCQCTS